MLDELEAASNDAIRAGTPITPSWHSVADVNDGNARDWLSIPRPLGCPSLLADPLLTQRPMDRDSTPQVPGLRKSSKALPPSVTGPVRVITFEGIDTNTCCGTHVQSTARLQAVKLLKVEKVRADPRSSPHVSRLGDRVTVRSPADARVTPVRPWRWV
jgi:hypothetical protein